jgi:recombinational DNA repair protein (RecF pathway)
MPPDNFDLGWTQFYLTCAKCGTRNNPVAVSDTRSTKACVSCGQPIDLKTPEALQARNDAITAAMGKVVKDAGG